MFFREAMAGASQDTIPRKSLPPEGCGGDIGEAVPRHQDPFMVHAG